VYAVVETGGKQYKVSAGETVDVEKLPFEVGETVELDRVLLVADGDKVHVGKPTVKGALSSSIGPESAIAARKGIGNPTLA